MGNWLLFPFGFKQNIADNIENSCFLAVSLLWIFWTYHHIPRIVIHVVLTGYLTEMVTQTLFRSNVKRFYFYRTVLVCPLSYIGHKNSKQIFFCVCFKQCISGKFLVNEKGCVAEKLMHTCCVLRHTILHYDSWKTADAVSIDTNEARVSGECVPSFCDHLKYLLVRLKYICAMGINNKIYYTITCNCAH